MESTRAIGYTLESAIADVIDNSIAAQASKVSIEFFPVGDAYLAILDNGTGMDEDELTSAMRYGAKSPTDVRSAGDLGRFGLGLKTASLSQCRRLTVICKKGTAVAGAQWDLDYVLKSGKWSLLVLDKKDIKDYPHVEDLIKEKSGTLVIWQGLDRMMTGEFDFEAGMGQKMDRVRDHLALVFHRYLAGESGIRRTEITVNTRKIKPIDPFLVGKSTQAMDDEIITVQGHEVMVRPYILPHTSKLSQAEFAMLGGDEGLKRYQGFYVYRNKRLLVWGTWFRMMRQGDLSKLARVRVDIPNSLDHLWTLDIKKSTAVPPEAVKKNLATIVERLAERSQRTWTYRGKKETDEGRIPIWNRGRTREGGIFYEVNRLHPLVQALINHMDPKGARALEQLLKHVERGLPLNALYVDLTTDERVSNDTEWTESELLQTAKAMLDAYADGGERAAFLAQLRTLDPFSRYPDLIAKITGEVE